MEGESYDAVCEGKGISVKFINTKKGKGILATKFFEEGDLIFSETPIVSCQYSYNKDYFEACSHCLKSMETPQKLLQRLANLPEEPVLAFSNEICPPIEKVFCENCLQEYYCSESCRKKAWDSYHQILCFGKDQSENHPLRKLENAWREIHYPPETANIMLLARVIAIMKVHAKSSQDIFGPFGKFKMEYVNRDMNKTHKFLEERFKANFDKLCDLMREALYEPKLDNIFSSDGFRALFCLMCLNAQGVGTSSLGFYERALADMMENGVNTDKIDEVNSFLDSLDDLIDEHSGQFVHAEGSSLFHLHSCLNHSCNPNALIVFENNNSTVDVIALKDIEPGEEITICYIDDPEEPYKERSKTLREFYLFNCECSKCIQEQSTSKSKKSKNDKHDHDHDPKGKSKAK